MRNKSLSKRLQQLSRNLEDTWDDLVHDDSSQIEREFNRLVGRLQRRHGYSPDHALDELQKQWSHYSKRTRSAVEKQLESLPLGRKKQPRRWPWVVGGLVTALYLGPTVVRWIVNQSTAGNGQSDPRANSHQGSARSGAANRKVPHEDASKKDLTSVEERSRESFPASDPPATW